MGNSPFLVSAESMPQHELALVRTRKTAEAKALITQLLAAGPRPAREVLETAQARGITHGTLYIATVRPCVERSRHGSPGDGGMGTCPCAPRAQDGGPIGPAVKIRTSSEVRTSNGA